MDAQMNVFKEKNSTRMPTVLLRVTYGNVKGYNQGCGGLWLLHLSWWSDGKIQTGDYEFDVPEKLISLYKNKDYGLMV